MKILKGEGGPKRDIVLLNSGTALVAADLAGTIKEGIALAANAIDSGKALDKLNALAQYTQEMG